jgi:hypothetical protein
VSVSDTLHTVQIASRHEEIQHIHRDLNEHQRVVLRYGAEREVSRLMGEREEGGGSDETIVERNGGYVQMAPVLATLQWYSLVTKCK